jgi:hypothetical protein
MCNHFTAAGATHLGESQTDVCNHDKVQDICSWRPLQCGTEHCKKQVVLLTTGSGSWRSLLYSRRSWT